MSKLEVRIEYDSWTDFEVSIKNVDESVRDKLVEATLKILQEAMTNGEVLPTLVRMPE